MTRADKSPVRREVEVRTGARIANPHSDRNHWVARITGEGVYMRAKGTRTEYGPVSWRAVMLHGVMLHIEAQKAAKKAKRKAKR